MNGLISQIGLDKFGDLTSGYSQSYSDNEGLWTAMFAAGEAFRYATTGSDKAKKNVIKLYEGVELLQNVTGQSGLLAKSLAMSKLDYRWVKYD